MQRIAPIRASKQANDGSTFDMMSSTSKNTFQLCSLDEFGGTNIWTCIELKEADNFAGSESDLGLGIGSKIKLVKSSVIQDPGSTNALDLKLNPDDSNEYILALGSGVAQRHKRFGDDQSPSTFKQPLSDGFADSCTSIAYSPFESDFFLAAFESGTLCLFNTMSSEPIAGWYHVCQEGFAVVKWSPFRPGVFFVLDGGGNLSVWDLLQSDQHAISTAPLGTSQGAQGVFALSSNVSHEQKGSSSSMIAFPSSRESGSLGEVRVHAVQSYLAEAIEPDEHKLFQELLEHMH